MKFQTFISSVQLQETIQHCGYIEKTETGIYSRTLEIETIKRNLFPFYPLKIYGSTF